MAKAIQVQLSFIYGRVKKLLDFGREHNMENQQGALKNATICTKIIDFVIDLRHHGVYSRILEAERCTLFELIQRSLFDYAMKRGYIKKGKSL